MGCWILPQPGQARLQANSGSISTISGNCLRRLSFWRSEVGADAQVSGGGGWASANLRGQTELDVLVDDAALLDARPDRGAPRAATTPSTSSSGADAPAVTPDGAARRRARPRSSSLASSTRTGGAAGAPGHLGQPVACSTSWPSRPRAPGRTRRRWPAPPPGGSGWRSRCRRRRGPTSAGKRSRRRSMTAAVSSRASVVWVRYATGSASATSRRVDLVGVVDDADALGRLADACPRPPRGRRGR